MKCLRSAPSVCASLVTVKCKLAACILTCACCCCILTQLVAALCSAGTKPANPFLPYDPDLWVTHLSDTHTLLLNKFNVVEHHLLVVTRQFESQLDPLNAADFAAIIKTLKVGPHLSYVSTRTTCSLPVQLLS